MVTISQLSIGALIGSIFFYYSEPYIIRQGFLLLYVFFGLIGFLERPKFNREQAFVLISLVLSFSTGILVELHLGSSPKREIIFEAGMLLCVLLCSVHLAGTPAIWRDHRLGDLIAAVQMILLLFSIASLFLDISVYLGQTHRAGPPGLLGVLRRANGIYTEPGMLANTSTMLWAIAAGLGIRSRLQFTLPFIVCLLTSSVAGVIFAILIAITFLLARKGSSRLSIFELLDLKRIIAISLLAVAVSPHVYQNILVPRLKMLEYHGNDVDSSATLKVTNILNVIALRPENLLLGSGTHANERVTFDNTEENGEANIRDGFAFVNSSGFLILLLFEYGIVSLLVIISLLLMAKAPLPVLVILLTRFGDAGTFVATLALLLTVFLQHRILFTEIEN